MGPVRKKALLDRFVTMEKIRSAEVEELASVDGIGPKLAEELADFLTRV
jgi:excinuclease ABC subunit C